MPQETQYLTNAAECERLSIVRGTRQQLGGRGHLRSGLFSVEEYAARRECKVQPAIRSHYADGGQHQIYDARSDQFAPVIAHDSPLFPVLTFEGLCGGIRAARLISPQCGVAATPDPRSILSSATEHIGSPSRPFEPPPVRRRPKGDVVVHPLGQSQSASRARRHRLEAARLALGRWSGERGHRGVEPSCLRLRRTTQHMRKP